MTPRQRASLIRQYRLDAAQCRRFCRDNFADDIFPELTRPTPDTELTQAAAEREKLAYSISPPLS